MQNFFTKSNEFDKYAREQDKWIYDNGWSYKGEHFSSYAFDEKRFGRIESGTLVEYLVMLRDEDSNRTIVLHGKGMELHELWSGVVKSQNDYLVMMDVVNKFIEESKNNLGAT